MLDSPSYPNPFYPRLFSTFQLRNVTFRNRLAMAPMSTELGGLKGEVTPQMIAFYRERALGGMGLIIVEYTCVDPDTGRAHANQLTLESRDNLDGHRRLVNTIHEAGAKIFMQIQHSGQYANSKVLPGGVSVGPCDIYSKKDPQKLVCRGLSSEEVDRMASAFKQTAALALEAGYDGVELHGAHGYLLTQFMSPLTNHRDDQWGGDLERRLAFPLAVVARVRKALGDHPLVYRLSADEFREGGITIDDMEKIAPHLVAAGADALHVSIGWGVGAAFEKVIEPMSTPEGWRIPYAARLRRATGVPVIAVGQIRWPETAEAAIADGDADLIALGRPMLADPQWANKAQAGQLDLIRPCTSCNWCISPHEGRVQVGCAENPRTGTELDQPLPTGVGHGRKAVVIGAGPGGMAAALMLDQCGFETHLFEGRSFAGGGLIASATPPGKDKLFWYNDFLKHRIDGTKINLHLSHRVTADEVGAIAPEITIVASGTTRIELPITGLAHRIVMDAYDVLMGDRDPQVSQGMHAMVYGGGETGCETAEYLAHKGLNVTLVTRSRSDQLARSAEWVYRRALIERLANNPLVTILANSTVLGVEDDGVTLEVADQGKQRIAVERLFLAQGRQSSRELQKELERRGLIFSAIGDSRQVGRIGDAVHMAYRAVQALAAQYAVPSSLAC